MKSPNEEANDTTTNLILLRLAGVGHDALGVLDGDELVDLVQRLVTQLQLVQNLHLHLKRTFR